MTNYDELDDILKDDDLFNEVELDDRLFSAERYQGTIHHSWTSSARKKITSGFDKYNKLFKAVQADIARGYRQVKSITEIEISQKSPIKKGNFYIDNGIMLYVEKIYNPDTGEEVLESANRRYKVHTVYENGTRNNIWLLSLISSLYDKKRNGRLVTEKIEDIDILGTNIVTGYIYVVQYAGTDSRFRELKNLYKIGVATDVQSRLSNTKNQATYLFAPVHLVKKYKISNIDATKIETAIHHRLSDRQVKLSVESPSGKNIEITEWFIVSIDEIDEIVNNLLAVSQY